MYSPDGAHQRLLAQKLPLSFDGTQDFAAHQAQIKEKLTELLGDRPERVPLDPIVEETVEHEEYTERRISFAVEQDVRAVCIFCIPKKSFIFQRTNAHYHHILTGNFVFCAENIFANAV